MSKGTIAAIVGSILVISLIGFNLIVADGSEDLPVTTSIRDDDNTTTTKAEAENEVANSDAARGRFIKYTPTAVADANKEGDKTVLFFSAAWCPTCQSLKRNLNAGIIPDGLTILELDYDTETALKQKHGVTFQHTLVQVDGAGETVTRWAGSYNINEIIDELI